MIQDSLGLLTLCFWLLLALRLRSAAPRRVAPGSPEGTRIGWFFFAAALGFRGAQALAYITNPLCDLPICDAHFYHDWAQKLAAGTDPYPVFWVDPLYPYILGGLYKLFGVSPRIATALGVLLGALTVRHIHRLASHVASAPAAFLAAALAAAYAPALYLDPLMLKSPIALYLTAAALDACAIQRAPALTGATCGLAVLNGAQSFGLAAIFGLSFVRWRRSPATFALALALTSTPALLHNLANGHAVFAHVGTGMILWASNNPGANGRHRPPTVIRRNPFTEVPDYTALASRELGRPVPPAEATAHFRAKAFAFLASDPAHTARLFTTKLGLLFNAYEWPDNYDFYVMRALFPALALPLPGWGFVTPFALIGLALALVRRPGTRLIAATALVLAAPLILTYSNDRLRHALLAASFPLAALTLTALHEGPPARRAFLAGALLVIGSLIHLETLRVPPSAWGCFVANEMLRAPTRAAARPIYAMLAHADPTDVRALVNLGSLLQMDGDHEGAAVLLTRAAQLAPREAPCYFALGHSLRRLGRARAAATTYAHALALSSEPVIALKLGLALIEAGEVPAGRSHLQSALPALDAAGLVAAEERAEGHYALAQVKKNAGDAEGAAREMAVVKSLMGR